MIAKSETKEKMLTAEERDSLRIRTRLLWFVKLGSLLSLCLAAFGEIARSYVSLAELIPTALAPVSINYCLPCALEVVPTLNTVLLGNFAVTYGCDSIAMSYGAPSMNNTHHYWSDCQALFRNRKFSSFFFHLQLMSNESSWGLPWYRPALPSPGIWISPPLSISWAC